MKFFTMTLLGMGLLFASVDINNATAKEITALAGIGEAKAKAIVEFRKGKCFKKAIDLTAVKGIGEKIVKKNEKDIKIGKCKK